MHSSSVSLLLTCLLLATSTFAGRTCTKRKRLDGAKLIIKSYNAVLPGQSAAGFARLPVAIDCHTLINPNGGPPVLVANDGVTTKDFALETRQLFSEVTGKFTDFSNGTTIIHTNVTLGLAHSFGVPVTFYADVFLFYDPATCLMQKIQAFAQIPTRVLGEIIDPPSIPI